MLDTLRVTDALALAPVSAPIQCGLTPADFENIPYHPAFLLAADLPAALIADASYVRACEAGYGSYFEEMYLHDGDVSLFTNCFYSRSYVMTYVADNVVEKDVRPFLLAPLPWRVGFVLGWLSALSLTDRPLALAGLEMLTLLAARLAAAGCLGGAI